MKREGCPIRRYMLFGLLLGCLVFYTLCGVAEAANVVTATLKITPSPTVKPGEVLKFQADIFYNPAFAETPSTIMRVWVTRHDFSWVSDKLDIQYPGMGSVHVNFTNGFTIPSDAKGGQTFDFYLVYGIWYPISNKASVKVRIPINIKDMKQKEYIKTAPVK